MNQNNEILLRIEGRKAIISLNRPKANSYYEGFLNNLTEKIQAASRNPQVKVILLNSTSEKFFCAGADIKIFSSNSTEHNHQMVLAARKANRAIAESPKIVIAAIAGHCLGGGLELALACDLRLAAEGDYLIGLPEIKLGLMPGNGGTPRLIDLIGKSRAMEMLVTGNPISPSQAHQYGLFNKLYPTDNFNEEVNKYVEELEQGAGKAMSAIKQFALKHKGMNDAEALELETQCVNALYDTPDAREGFLAFVEKRPPQFE